MKVLAFPSPADRELEAIERQARKWVVLGAERALTATEEGELSSWLQADVRQARIYASMCRTWADMGEGLASSRFTAPPLRIAESWQASVLAAALAAAAALALLVVAPQWTDPARQAQQTALAEIRRMTLADGSVVTLGAHTRIEVNFARDERRVILERGEAFFEVARDETRPFFVQAGAAFVRVVGTKFNVNLADEHVSVEVLEGVVRVQHTELLGVAQRGEVWELRAGQRAELGAPSSPIAFSALSASVTASATHPGAWRDGRLDYNDARLGELVADINRYYAPGVRLADPALADLRVTASFRPNEVDRILRVLDQATPIDVSGTATGTFVLSPAPATTLEAR